MSDAISKIDFSGNSFRVEQKAIRNAYKVYNSDGEEILRTKQKLFKMKEEFPFTDPEGKEIFTVKAENLMDITGDYVITDSGSGEKIAVLRKNFSILVHSWEVQDADGNKIATVESRGKLFGVLRAVSDLANFLPHKYTIRDSEGEEIGRIKGELSIRDKYSININEGIKNKEAILAAAVTIDALEGN